MRVKVKDEPACVRIASLSRGALFLYPVSDDVHLLVSEMACGLTPTKSVNLVDGVFDDIDGNTLVRVVAQVRELEVE